VSAETLEPGADNYAVFGEVVDNAPAIHSLSEHAFEMSTRHAADERAHHKLSARGDVIAPRRADNFGTRIRLRRIK
jgi:hypothetical protein